MTNRSHPPPAKKWSDFVSLYMRLFQKRYYLYVCNRQSEASAIIIRRIIFDDVVSDNLCSCPSEMRKSPEHRRRRPGSVSAVASRVDRRVVSVQRWAADRPGTEPSRRTRWTQESAVDGERLQMADRPRCSHRKHRTETLGSDG